MFSWFAFSGCKQVLINLLHHSNLSTCIYNYLYREECLLSRLFSITDHSSIHDLFLFCVLLYAVFENLNITYKILVFFVNGASIFFNI